MTPAIRHAIAAATLVGAGTELVAGEPAPPEFEWLTTRGEMSRAPTLASLALLVQTAGVSAHAAMLRISFEVATKAVATIVPVLIADTQPEDANLPGVALVATSAAVSRIIAECTATRIATGEVRRAFLAASTAIGIVRGEIGTYAATTALTCLAACPIAAISFIDTDIAARAAGERIAAAFDAVTATIREIRRARTDVAAHFALVAHGPAAAAALLFLAARLTYKATSFPGRRRIRNGGKAAAEHCAECGADNASSRRCIAQ
jgi:hypothetical protein